MKTTLDHIVPDGLDAFRASVLSNEIGEIELHNELKSVSDYSDHEKVPEKFPRPSDHYVIADHLIDLPVVAVDFSVTQGHHGRVIAYSHGNFWVLADTLAEFTKNIGEIGTSALWGKP
jgi:hypothetical protein